MENSKFCYGCMSEQPGTGPCPACGYDRAQAPTPQYLPPGTVLADKYLIGKVIGHGGFGITYLGYDTVLGIKLAVKEYLVPEYAYRNPQGRVTAYEGEGKEKFEEGIRRFLEEARILALFEGNPGIVSVRDFFRANGTAYLVMSYLEGQTLRQYLKKNGPMPYAVARQELLPVLTGALSAVHSAGLLHRDISPDNIFLTTGNQVKIIDFGAARQVAGSAKSISIILKPGYAPEEQYRSHGKQGPWTDVYAVAATIYRAITGKVPPESLDRQANDTLVPPSQMCDISPAQEAVLLKAMSVKAEDRYQSMRQFYSAVLAASEGEPAPGAALQFPTEPGLEDTQRHAPIVPIAPPPEPLSQEEEDTGDRAIRTSVNIVKLLVALAVICGVIALCIVFVQLFFENFRLDMIFGARETLPPVVTDAPAATDAVITADPAVTNDPAATDDPTMDADPTPGVTPTTGAAMLTAAPMDIVPGQSFPQTSSISVNAPAFHTPQAVYDVASYLPAAGQKIVYQTSAGSYSLITAQPASGAGSLVTFVGDAASPLYGQVDVYFIRSGSLYMLRETTGKTSLVLPYGADAGTSWTDEEGQKSIFATNADISVGGAHYEGCLIVEAVTGEGTRYRIYKPGTGLLAEVDDYLAPTVIYSQQMQASSATGDETAQAQSASVYAPYVSQ